MNQFLVPHDPSWKKKYLDESEQLCQALGRNVVAIHHIGGTSIPDVYAKPIIDVLVEVLRTSQVDDQCDLMHELSYESMGEYGIAGRRYFRKHGPNGRRSFHVRVFETSSIHAMRHIAFRDFLLAHPEKAKEYSDLKLRLVSTSEVPAIDDQNSKAPFIEACLADAIE